MLEIADKSDSTTDDAEADGTMISSFEVLIFIGALFATWHLAPSHIRSRVLELSRRWARTVPIKPKLEPIAAGKGEESTEKKEGWEDLTPGRRPGGALRRRHDETATD